MPADLKSLWNDLYGRYLVWHADRYNYAEALQVLEEAAPLPPEIQPVGKGPQVELESFKIARDTRQRARRAQRSMARMASVSISTGTIAAASNPFANVTATGMPKAYTPPARPANPVSETVPALAPITDELPPALPSRERPYADITVQGSWERCPYTHDDVQTINRLPIISNQLRTLLEHVITSATTIQGLPAAVEPAREWFEVTAVVASRHQATPSAFVRQIAIQLLRYGTCIVVKHRAYGEAYKGHTDPVDGSPVPHLAGWHIPDMSQVEAFVDTKGRVRRWRYELLMAGQYRTTSWDQRDVLVLRLPSSVSRPTGFWTPPYSYPALYPALVLTELQKVLDSHTRSLGQPRRYASVGNKDYLNGRVPPDDIKTVQRDLTAAGPGSLPVLPWTVELKEVAASNYVTDFISSAEYWEREIRRAIGGSTLSDGVGDSGTRNTSDNLMDKEMLSAETLTSEIVRAFTWLALDKVYEANVKVSQMKRGSDLPTLRFDDIDAAREESRQTHAVYLWTNDAITHSELAERIGIEKSAARGKKYYSEVQAETNPPAAPGAKPAAARESQSRAMPAKPAPKVK